MDINVRYDRFHPVMGPDFKIGLEANFQTDDLILKTDIPLAERLTHQNGNLVKLYYPALSDYADLMKYHEGWIRFFPWFNIDVIRNRRIGFWSPSVVSGVQDRWIWLGRHGEDRPFTFSVEKKGFIYLDFMSKRPDFLPLFIKVKNRKNDQNEMPEIVSFVIEAHTEPLENGAIQLNLRHVEEEELPSCLAGLRPEGHQLQSA